MRFRVGGFLSLVLGVATGLLTLVVVLASLGRWSQPETDRTPPFSQAGFFYGMAVLAALGVVEVALALRGGRQVRAAGMTLIGLTLFLLGINSSLGLGGPDAIGSRLVEVGLLGLIGAGLAIAAAPRPMVAAAAGLLGSIPLMAAMYWSGSIVTGLFP